MTTAIPSNDEPSSSRGSSDVKQRIHRYIDHLQDAAYVNSIFDQAGIQVVLGTIVEMLRSGRRPDANDALLFVQDTVLFGFVPALRHRLADSGVFAAFTENLYARDENVRHNTIHTLGRIGPRRNAGLLVDAFGWYLDHDPLNVPGVLSGLFWLFGRSRRGARWVYIDKAARHSSYVTRWAALEAVGHDLYRSRDRTFTLARRICQKVCEKGRSGQI